jgi:uncharacterized protein (DUF362 family)
MVKRRQFLVGAAAAAISGTATGCRRQPPWDAAGNRKPAQSRVAILEARNDDIVYRGLGLFGLPLDGKKVVLKPNLVEYDPEGGINTHPTLIAAAIDAFRRHGAREVVVAEGPGHRRDNEYLLGASGLASVLSEYGVRYVDLNYDDVRAVPLRSHFTSLGHLYLPETVLDADLLVSMPKLKTHHWAGVTLSMKNFFGIIPSAIYGWPKNVLHWEGIHESILDINSAIPVPRFAIVDGIVGMEGNGPIQGERRACGTLVFGDDLVAVDATAARLMTIDPAQISYLREAGEFLGNLAPDDILSLGEDLNRFRQDFTVMKRFQHLKVFSG